MNYEAEFEKITGNLEGVPALLLHSCCAPCSSACLERVCTLFRVTVFYYNPNISASEEYAKRLAEQKRLIAGYNEEMEAGTRQGYPISVIDGEYEPEEFYRIARGYEDCPERGERCFRCYEQRLRRCAEAAKQEGFDYFATTLTLSPLKDAAKLNEIGFSLEEEIGVPYLPSDFKKKGGYQRSIELSKEYDLYRQDYCGCVYSKAERERQKSAREGSNT